MNDTPLCNNPVLAWVGTIPGLIYKIHTSQMQGTNMFKDFLHLFSWRHCSEIITSLSSRVVQDSSAAFLLPGIQMDCNLYQLPPGRFYHHPSAGALRKAHPSGDLTYKDFFPREQPKSLHLTQRLSSHNKENADTRGRFRRNFKRRATAAPLLTHQTWW